MKTLKKNYINSLNFEIAKECSKKGIGYELLYINENGNLKTKKCSANDIIPVYSDKLGEFLECAIRIWTDYDIDGNLICDHANVYTNKDIIIFERSNLLEEYKLVDAKSHLLDDIPIIVYWNNEECSSDFEDVLPLIDAYDKSQSDTANDMEYFTDAYLCIIGAAGGFETGIDTEEDSSQAADELRKNRLLFLDEKGQAEWLTKNINDTAVENYKNRLFSNIFFLSQVPALTDESFAGNLTGVAIRYKLIGLEELAIMKENKFEAAQRKKIKMITAHLNMCMNKSYNPQEVTFKFERNFVDNVTELIENATKLEGITSKETQLNALPNNIVPDSKEEMERMEEERIRSEQLPMVTKEKVDDLFSETGDS